MICTARNGVRTTCGRPSAAGAMRSETVTDAGDAWVSWAGAGRRRLVRCFAAGLIAGFPAVPAVAADPLSSTDPARRSLPPVPLVPFRPLLRSATGGCLPGFAVNTFGLCARHDDPRIVCDPEPPGPPVCRVAAPNPIPYGPGAAFRLDY